MVGGLLENWNGFSGFVFSLNFTAPVLFLFRGRFGGAGNRRHRVGGYILFSGCYDDQVTSLVLKGIKMRYAETGYNLEIDLTRGIIEREESDPGLTELYLGGLGDQCQDPVGSGPSRG